MRIIPVKYLFVFFCILHTGIIHAMLSNVPLQLMAGGGLPGPILQYLMKTGMDDYISKPFKTNDITKIIEKLKL